MLKLAKRNNKRGFTLIELIVVIAILGILAAILVPTMVGVVGDANTKVANANARTLFSAAQAAFVSESVEGTVAADTYTSADDAADPFMVAVASNLGSGFDEAYSITVTAAGVTTVTYDGTTYAG